MKKKTKTYLLLGLVIVIWGIIGYQLISSLHLKEQEVATEGPKAVFAPKDIGSQEAFSIDVVKRDPFLGKIYRPEITKNISKKPPAEPIIWPPIAYQGMLKKQGSKKQTVFAISINNQQYVLKIGQAVEEITLLLGDADEILLRYKNRKKTIPIQ